jgi:Dockerin type I domain
MRKSNAAMFAFLCVVTGGFSGHSFGAGESTWDISRVTLDSGGAIQSTGGDFELSGTIGQPDAGVLSGGDFQLSGGFWIAILPADCNEDGLINALDHERFAACLTGPESEIGTNSCRCYDTDGDGDITLGDFATLQQNFSGP